VVPPGGGGGGGGGGGAYDPDAQKAARAQFDRHIKVICGSADKHRNAPVGALFTDTAFSDACWRHGFKQMAVALRVFGAAWEAYDMRLHERSLLVALLAQPYCLRADRTLPQSVRGIGARTLMAFWHNGDAFTW
jgi:hypothetical protein